MEYVSAKIDENDYLANRTKGNSVGNLLKYAGAWKNISEEDIRKMKKEIRKWRAVERKLII